MALFNLRSFDLPIGKYINGQRFTETLELYLSPNAPENKEVMKLAESIRAKRELEILHSEHGFIPAY